MKQVVLFLLIGITLNFSVFAQKAMPPDGKLKENLTDKEIIQKVIFLDLMKNRKDEIEFYFFGVDSGDNPSKRLLEEFRDNKPRVYEFTKASLENDGIADKESGKNGVLFLIGRLEWIDENTVETYAYSSSGNMSGVGCNYVLRREKKFWKIIERSDCTVS